MKHLTETECKSIINKSIAKMNAVLNDQPEPREIHYYDDNFSNDEGFFTAFTGVSCDEFEILREETYKKMPPELYAIIKERHRKKFAETFIPDYKAQFN